MKKKYIFIVILVIIIISSLFFFFQFRRTAYTIANLHTGLDFSKEYHVETFEDEWGINGDGKSIIVFKLNELQEKKLITKCKKLNLNHLPIDMDIPDHIIYGYNFIEEGDSLGYYKLEIDSIDNMSYKLFILDIQRNKFIVLNVIY